MRVRRHSFSEQDLPQGYQIYEDRLYVSGVGPRKREAIAFANAKLRWLELEREPDNETDPNACRVMGCSRVRLGTKRCHIGYIPRDAAQRIVEGGFEDAVQLRLLKTYVGSGDFVEIEFHILGPKDREGEYRSPRSKPIDAEDEPEIVRFAGQRA